MRCYRLLLDQYDPLSADGAISLGGRFNSPGKPMLYLAASEAVAILESRVHTPYLNSLQRTLHEIEIPGPLVVRPEDLGTPLPSDWNTIPVSQSAREFGDHWVDGRRSLALRVPSVPGGMDGNVLVNILHPEFQANVKVVGGRPFVFDERLFFFDHQ